MPEVYISAMLGQSVMVPPQDSWRIHELAAATTTLQNYFDNHPENREIARQKRMLDDLAKIREEMYEFYWPQSNATAPARMLEAEQKQKRRRAWKKVWCFCEKIAT